ncbi:MAG: hypothetical protein ABIP36_02485 [Acidimicrobiales bacterium]
MEEADALYALAPETFVAARNALAKQLRKESRKLDATTVLALRRPSAAAWALNQVARTEPALVTRAIEAGVELRAASEGAGAGDPSGLRAATKTERQAANEVVQAAAAHLGGRVDAQRSALLATLRVAALDGDVAGQLERGVLSTDHEQPGFGFGLEVDGSPVAPRPARAPKEAAQKKPTLSQAALRVVPDLAPDDDDAAGAEAEAEQAKVAEEQAVAAKAERAAERLRLKERAGRQRTADRLAREAARLVHAAEATEAEAQQARAEADEAVRAAGAAAEAVGRA